MDYDAKFRFLQELLGKGRYYSKNKEALFFCPFCKHHKPKLAVNIEEDLWQDWVCGEKGNLYKLIKKLGSSVQLQTYLDNFKSNNVKIDKKTDEIESFKVFLPQEYVPLVEYKNHILGRKYYDYLLEARKIDEIDILRHKIGVAFDGQYKEKIIFPSFNKLGLVNFYTARGFDGHYWQPSVPKGYKYSIILNELNLEFTKPLVIVEGFFDMAKSMPNTAYLFGSTLPMDSLLFHTIVENNTSVYVGLDPDAEAKALKLLDNLLRYGILVYRIDVKPFKDIGEMTKEQFLEALGKSTNVNEKDVLRNRIKNI